MPYPLTFLSCHLDAAGNRRLIASRDGVEEEHALLLRHEPAGSAFAMSVADWAAIRWVGWPDAPQGPFAVCLSAAGDFRRATPEDDLEGEIGPGPGGPSEAGHLRDLRLMEGGLVAVGMSRQAWASRDGIAWTRIDQGCRAEPDPLTVTGFNACDGTGPEDLWAVGFDGVIWRRQGSVWRQLPSPTNVGLLAVCRVRDDLAFAAGQLGTLLRWDGRAWHDLPQEDCAGDFWSLAWFAGHLHLAGGDRLWRLEDDGSLAGIDAGMADGVTCLSANAQELLLIGPKQAAVSADGAAFTDITP